MMQQKWTIRLIITDGDIRRISLDQKPNNLQSLLDHLKNELALPYEFKLPFEVLSRSFPSLAHSPHQTHMIQRYYIQVERNLS